jgi:hypothetical protein
VQLYSREGKLANASVNLHTTMRCCREEKSGCKWADTESDEARYEKAAAENTVAERRLGGVC